MKKVEDQTLIENVLKGDTKSFGVLVARYKDYIFTVVYRMLKVREDAEEVTQDAFLKAFEALPTFRGEAKFSTWIYRIAYRKALDKLKINKRNQHLELIEDQTEGEIVDIENALKYIIDEERKQIIQNCILQLGEVEAAIITMYYFDELSVKEIVDITALTEDNIKVKLYRSRKRLFTLLKDSIHPEKLKTNERAI